MLNFVFAFFLVPLCVRFPILFGGWYGLNVLTKGFCLNWEFTMACMDIGVGM